jgi:hypothetical protein
MTGQPSNRRIIESSGDCEKKEIQSANELIDFTASQGRNRKQKARWAGHGQRHGQDFNTRP